MYPALLRSHAVAAAIGAAVLIPSSVVSAAFIDEFTDTSNVRPRGGDLTVNATNGRLIATRNVTGFTNIDYYEDAASIDADGFNPASNTFSLTDQSIFTIVDAQQINPDAGNDTFIAVRAFYFDGSDQFLSEVLLLGDSAATGDLSFNLNDAAPTGAAAYNILISIIATADAGDGYSFESFTATDVPEPASLALVGLGGLLIAKRCRRVP